MGKKLIGIIIVLVIIVGVFVILDMSKENIDINDDVALTGETKEFDIVSTDWEFLPKIMEVSLGDKVELHLESEEGTHGFAILEFGVSETMIEGEDVHVDFIADRKGTFNYFCSVPCGRGHGAMRGLLVVR